MRNSKTLAKLRAGKPVKMGMMGHFLPSYVAHAAHFGYDAIWLDLEHRPMNGREVQGILAFFHLYDIDCIVRPPTTEKAALYRYLEDGATGLMIPQVLDAATARELVQKVKFPPLGDRGYEGRSLETNFSIDMIGADRSKLINHALQETVLAIQIETPQALAEVDEIAAIDGVDILFIGPADMSIRMAVQPPDKKLSMEQIMDRVAAVCQKHGKAWGNMPANLDQVKEFARRGAQVIPWKNDLMILFEGLERHSQELAQIYGE